MSKSIFIDTTICTACRGCQVACKQWHDLPAEKTQNMGNYQNPQDLTSATYKLVKMTEIEINNRLQWLFFPDQCRHCEDAPCVEVCPTKATSRENIEQPVLIKQELCIGCRWCC